MQFMSDFRTAFITTDYLFILFMCVISRISLPGKWGVNVRQMSCEDDSLHSSQQMSFKNDLKIETTKEYTL